eukprot:8478536-Pyramimonas_sp.AAC.1
MHSSSVRGDAGLPGAAAPDEPPARGVRPQCGPRRCQDGPRQRRAAWPAPLGTLRSRRCHPDIGRLEKIEAEVFRRFRPLGALAALGDRRKTARDDAPVLGKWSGGRGHVSRKNRDVG